MHSLTFESLPLPERNRAVLNYLSSSIFGDVSWKRKAVEFAAKLLTTGPKDALLAAKINLRYVTLCQLYPTQFTRREMVTLPDASLQSSPCYNAHKADELLSKVQGLMYEDNLPLAYDLLDQFKPLRVIKISKISSEEKRKMQKIHIYKQRVLRFAGEFQEARENLNLLDTIDLSPELVPGYFTDMAILSSELGDAGDIYRYPIKFSTDLKATKRMSLGAAGVALAQGLQLVEGSQGFLEQARTTYTSLGSTYKDMPVRGRASCFRYITVSIGLAICAHFQFREDRTQLVDIVSHWESAFQVTEKMRIEIPMEVTFLQMIIYYSQSDLFHLRGSTTQAKRILEEARKLYQRCGRRFYWQFLGSSWFDIVGAWVKQHGYNPLDEMKYEGYLEKQRARGFPHKLHSTRA